METKNKELLTETEPEDCKSLCVVCIGSIYILMTSVNIKTQDKALG